MYPQSNVKDSIVRAGSETLSTHRLCLLHPFGLELVDSFQEILSIDSID